MQAKSRRLPGLARAVALHVLWDFPRVWEDVPAVASVAERFGIRPGAINPNLFQGQDYKYGSFGNPDEKVRAAALERCEESITIARMLKSRDISLWFADGSKLSGNREYPAAKALV
jgi:L-rhamnose isomerase/sugar isomerase